MTSHGFHLSSCPFMRCNPACSPAHIRHISSVPKTFFGSWSNNPAIVDTLTRRVVWGSTSLGMKTIWRYNLVYGILSGPFYPAAGSYTSSNIYLLFMLSPSYIFNFESGRIMGQWYTHSCVKLYSSLQKANILVLNKFQLLSIISCKAAITAISTAK